VIYENSTLIASRAFRRRPQPPGDVDLDRLADRMRQNTFGASMRRHADQVFSTIERCNSQRSSSVGRKIEKHRRSRDQTRDARCEEVYRIQVQGLVTRMRATGSKQLVIGVSGGLDSTQALIVCAKAMDELRLPRRNILAYTMPGFATSTRTKSQAWQLMRAVGATAEEIDIRPSCLQMLKDIGHPYAKGKKVYDVTFENVQAGERTSHLFRLANFHGGMVVGTGDLSELALGWATYGVGDHMSHYNVNASVPKTLIQFLIGWVAESGEFGADVKRALRRVLETEISPELVPGRQSSEATVGPYELQDFHLYYILRFGYSPAKVAFLAWHAWRDKYKLPAIRKWLGVFLKRFFQNQFKRSAIPNAPKVGSGGSLSPRGDWRAPSDACNGVVENLKAVPASEK
jgi:NAD+ synthase (glutamine-hydrolysing)